LNSAIAWRGVSELDGTTPIVVVFTGLAGGSKNTKTGPAVQAHVLVDRALPHVAAKLGLDRAICGDCPRRRTASRGSTCYVSLAFEYTKIGKKLVEETYTVLERPGEAVSGRFVRVGAYGDPAAVPIAFWMDVVGRADGWTAYTHQWRHAHALRAIAMASVESPEENREAKAAGWRTYRIRPPLPGEGFTLARHESMCPASVEAGKTTTCAECRRCSGLASPGRDVAIIDHSVKALWERDLGPRRRLPIAEQRT
jgi:hypothetical protein